MTRILLVAVLAVLMFPPPAQARICRDGHEQIVQLVARETNCTTARRVAKLISRGGRVPNWRCRATTVRDDRVRTVCRRRDATVIVVWRPRIMIDPTPPRPAPTPLPVPVPPLPVPIPQVPCVPIPAVPC